MLAFIFILLVIAIFCFYFVFVISKKTKKGLELFVIENNVILTKKSNRFSDGKLIIYDEVKNLIWIYRPFVKKQICFPVGSITGCELIIDDESNFKTSISSAAGRSIVGGILAGPVGAIIGGSTANKKGSTVVKKMELIISTSDLNNPYVKILVLKDSKGTKKDGFLFKAQYDGALYWCKFIEALINLQKVEPLS